MKSEAKPKPKSKLKLQLNLPTKILLFLLVNYVSTWVVSFMYLFATRIVAFVDINSPGFDEAALFKLYMLHSWVTLLICAAFSISFLFLRSNWRYVFLLSPLIVPPLYGLAFLIRYQA